MAKRRKKRHGGHHKRKHRGGGGRRRGLGGIASGLPVMEAVAGAAVGFIEKTAKADQNFFLNALIAKSPIDALGFTGNLTALAWLVNKFGGGIVPASIRPYLREGIKLGAGITAYQLVRQDKAFAKATDFFTISGPDHMENRRNRGKGGEPESQRVSGADRGDRGEGRHRMHHYDDEYDDDEPFQRHPDHDEDEGDEHLVDDEEIGEVGDEVAGWRATVDVDKTPDEAPAATSG